MRPFLIFFGAISTWKVCFSAIECYWHDFPLRLSSSTYHSFKICLSVILYFLVFSILFIKSMPFCALNVPELPLHEWIKDRSPSPCVVDIQEYMKYQPQVHIYRGALAPLDVAFTCLWTLNPEFLQQFLNPRLPLCIFRSTRKINPRSTSEVTFVRLKIADSLHLIMVRSKRQCFQMYFTLIIILAGEVLEIERGRKRRHYTCKAVLYYRWKYSTL